MKQTIVLDQAKYFDDHIAGLSEGKAKYGVLELNIVHQKLQLQLN